MGDTFDIIIVGAGIAGSGLAWHLAPRRRVLVLEQEHIAGYHTTGRSAAFFAETYGGPVIQPLSTASRSFLAAPPTGFTETPLLRQKGILHVFGRGQRARAKALLDEMAAVEGVCEIGNAETLERVPCLDTDRIKGAVLDPSCGDLDVAALHQAYMKGAKVSGAEFRTNCGLMDASYDGRWRVTTQSGVVVHGDVLVNAAGAWADTVAERAGLRPVGLTPKRRTLITAELDRPVDPDWPIVIDIEEKWYFRVEGPGVLISPADATPSAPCDVQPEELDVATAADRFEAVTTTRIKKIESRWAGLRTFAADNAPVIGFDPGCPGFFWSAGQGGWGIQTSPAWSHLAASMILAGPGGAVTGPVGADIRDYSPARFID